MSETKQKKGQPLDLGSLSLENLTANLQQQKDNSNVTSGFTQFGSMRTEPVKPNNTTSTNFGNRRTGNTTEGTQTQPPTTHSNTFFENVAKSQNNKSGGQGSNDFFANVPNSNSVTQQVQPQPMPKIQPQVQPQPQPQPTVQPQVQAQPQAQSKPVVEQPKTEDTPKKKMKNIAIDSETSTGLLSARAKQGDAIASHELTNRYKKSKSKVKKLTTITVVLAVIVAVLCIISWYTRNSMVDTQEKIESLEAQKEALQSEIDGLKNSEENLKNSLDSYMAEKAYHKVIQVADTIHEEHPNTDTDKHAQKQAKKAKAELDKLGIETGESTDQISVKAEDYQQVNYDKLKASAKKYVGQKGKVYGKVLQIEDARDTDYSTMRVAVDGNIQNVILVQFNKSANISVAEGDFVNTGGIIVGDITYKTIIGTKITVPAISADYVSKVA